MSSTPAAEPTPVRFTVNGRPVRVTVPADTPLLWVLREELGLTGSKFGCGIGLCGACTVHVGGAPVRSCLAGVASLEGAAVTTIEGLADSHPGDGPHPLQAAWVDAQAPQCGYCQSGQLMQAAALLERTPSPTDADIDAAMSGNLCRCMAYPRIRRAIHLAAGRSEGDGRA